MSELRAAVFGGSGAGLVIEEVPDPTPGPREVIIKVERCGVCGTDLHFTDGKGFVQAPAGTVLGHEYAGEIVAVGRDVTKLVIGDHITGLAAIAACGRCEECGTGDLQWCTGADKLYPASGGYAEYAPVAEPQAVKLPTSMALADGALVEPLAVALHGSRLAAMPPEAGVLIIGAGPIGIATVFWARQLGARKIVVQARSRLRARYATAMGANAFACSDEEAADALGGPPDVVFEACGAPGCIETAMRAVRTRGTVVVLGWCGVPDSFIPAMFLMKEISLQFSMTYSVKDFEDAIDVLAAGAAEPSAMVSKTVPLTGLPLEFEGLRHSSTECKVLVDPTR